MTANSTYSTYASHSPLKHRVSFSNASAYNANANNNEEAETLEEEEIWPIMEGIVYTMNKKKKKKKKKTFFIT